MDVFNLHGDEWDGRPGAGRLAQSREASVRQRIGAELIGGSLYELEPGDRLWPYHTHHANEEWLARRPRGAHAALTRRRAATCARATSSCFRRGKDGAHQVSNRTDVRRSAS